MIIIINNLKQTSTIGTRSNNILGTNFHCYNVEICTDIVLSQAPYSSLAKPNISDQSLTGPNS